MEMLNIIKEQLRTRSNRTSNVNSTQGNSSNSSQRPDDIDKDIEYILSHLESPEALAHVGELKQEITKTLNDPSQRQKFIQDFNSFKKRFEIYKNPKKALENDKQALLFVESANISIPAAIFTSIAKGDLHMNRVVAGSEILFCTIVQTSLIAYDIFHLIQMKINGLIDGKE